MATLNELFQPDGAAAPVDMQPEPEVSLTDSDSDRDRDGDLDADEGTAPPTFAGDAGDDFGG